MFGAFAGFVAVLMFGVGVIATSAYNSSDPLEGSVPAAAGSSGPIAVELGDLFIKPAALTATAGPVTFEERSPEGASRFELQAVSVERFDVGAIIPSGEAVRHRRAVEPLGHRPAVRADGLGGADPRRPLGALAAALGRARRPAARDRALPALDLSRAARDATRADRSAHEPRQPSALPRALTGGADPCEPNEGFRICGQGGNRPVRLGRTFPCQFGHGFLPCVRVF